MQVRTANKEDVVQIHAIETRCFNTPWSMASFEYEFDGNHFAYYVVAEEMCGQGSFVEKKIIGFAGYWHVIDEVHITNIAVDPAYRRCGVAKKMIDHLLAYAVSQRMRTATLEVRVSNTSAITLYEGKGFEIGGRRKEYYVDNGEDAYVMWKQLNHEEG